MMQTIKRTSLANRLAARLRGARAFLADRSGMSFVVTALTLPVLLGMAGLGFDATIWYMEKRENQTVADNAALTATIALNRDSAKTEVQLLTIVKEDAARNGYDLGSTRQIVLNNPPDSGPNQGDALFVEVIATEQRNLYLSSFVYNGPVNVTARAVGGIRFIGEHCIVALSETVDKAIEFTGAADATIGCGIASNSNSDTAISIDGNADLEAEPLQAFGDIYESGNATLTSAYPPAPLSERVEDPYYDQVMGITSGVPLIPQMTGACTSTSLPTKVSGTTTLKSNYPLGNVEQYCGGIAIQAAADVFMEPGVYVIDDGDFLISGGARVRGVDVTVILTAWDPSTKTNQVGNFIIMGGADVILSAPTTGDYAGLLFIQDPSAPTDYGGAPEQNLLTGGTDMSLTGAIYTPTRETVLIGNTNTNTASSCTQIIAFKVTISGAATIDNDPAACAAAGVTAMLETRVRLFE